MIIGTASLSRVFALLLSLPLAGCSLFIGEKPVPLAVEAVDAPVAPDPAAPRLAPLPTRHFEAVTANQQIVGDVQVIFARHENTFVHIARQYDIGYDALRNANPDVDHWLPGEGTPVYLPTMSVLPDASRDGIVLNLPAMRMFYFTPEPAADEAAEALAAAPTYSVTSHPIGIGREGWATPLGDASVTQKARDPTWYPPASVRAEHEALGDPLPGIVPPGPDNPLGRFAMRLSIPGYLIHGTNKPAGVGMRVSHGCIRLYPEDIEALYERVSLDTPVRIVDQPVLAGWRDGQLYLEIHPPLAEDTRDLSVLAREVVGAALAGSDHTVEEVHWERVDEIVAARRGMPFPVLDASYPPERYLARVRVVENLVPVAIEQSAANR